MKGAAASNAAHPTEGLLTAGGAAAAVSRGCSRVLHEQQTCAHMQRLQQSLALAENLAHLVEVVVAVLEQLLALLLPHLERALLQATQISGVSNSST